MANQEHLDILRQGVDVWNKWRKQHSDIQPDLHEADLRGNNLRQAYLSDASLSQANLSRADLSGADLSGANLFRTDLSYARLIKANLSGVNLSRANLFRTDLRHTISWGADISKANLRQADLTWADLSGADLAFSDFSGASLGEARLIKANLIKAYLSSTNLWGTILRGADLKFATLTDATCLGADLSSADLSDADLSRASLPGVNLKGANFWRANLSRANFSEANLSEVDLSGADLSGASFVNVDFTNADLTNCRIYGISAWDVHLQNTLQSNLIITRYNQPTIAIDNLEVAQFIYLLLNNSKIRDVIDTIAKKAVLILGRFTPERKSILEAIRTVLRNLGYLPILFDFPKPESQDLTGTVSTLANISRFIIADLTDPSCSPYEIGLIAPCMKPIKPLFQTSKTARYEFAMFKDLRKRYSWVLPVYHYKDQESLMAALQEKVIAPAEQKVQLLEKKKRR